MATILTQKEHDTLREALEYGQEARPRSPLFAKALSILEGVRGREGETTVELVPNNYDCMLTCSKCWDGVPYYLMEEFDEMNFCPNCGRRFNKANHGNAPNPSEDPSV